MIFNEFRVAPLSFLCNYYIICKTLKKEGRAFRSIGNKKMYIFPTKFSLASFVPMVYKHL